MGTESTLLLLILVVALNMSHESVAQSAGCTTALISLSPCLNYITGSGSSSSSTTPSSSCCSRLATVVQSRPQCLCSALNGGAAASLGVIINQTRALALPAACNVQTPPPSRCNDGSGAAAPAISPVSSPENSPLELEPSDGEELGEAPTATTFKATYPPPEIDSRNVPITGGIPSTARSLINMSFYNLFSVGIFLAALLSLMN